MAKYRFATLLSSESCATAGTKPINIDVTDPISVISITLKSTPVGTVPTAHPAGNITKIEIVDGSNVIAALTGKECQALDFHNTKVMPDTHVSDVAGVQAWATCNLRFGRKLWDTDLALDPSRFDNLKLNISHNYRVADTAASAATLEVYAHMFDERKISPLGYLRPTEIYAYTNGVSGTVESIDLPRDLSIRQLIVNTYGDGYLPWAIANKVKILENGGAKIPYDFRSAAWLKLIKQQYPMALEKFVQANAVASRVLYCAPSFEAMPAMIGANAAAILSQPAVTEAPPLHLVGSAATTISGVVAGFCPHGAFPIQFGDQMDFTDWYDVTPLGSLKLEIASGGAGINGSTKIVLEQLKRYGV